MAAITIEDIIKEAEIIKKKFSERLKKIRTLRELSHTRLAKMLGITGPNIS